MFRSMLVAFAALYSFSVFAVDLDIPSGRYTSGEYAPTPEDKTSGFNILKRGSRVQIIDLKNNIRYSLDLNKTEEQPVNERYIELMKNMPVTRVYGQITKSIGLSDLRQHASNEFRGIMNLHFEVKSVFGSINTVLQVGIGVKKGKCTAGVYEPPDFAYKQVEKDCLTIDTGYTIGLKSLESGLGEATNRILGLAIDFSLKAFSPMFSTSEKLFHHP